MKLAIVILNWNGKNDTLACLQSLPTDYLIVVVDNGSADDSVEAIRKQFPRVTLIPTGENLGYAGGNNVGIQHALSQEADLVFLLNNDTIVDKECIPALLRQAQESPQIGIFGAYPLRMNEPTKLDHLGGIWNRSTASFKLIGLGASDGYKASESLDYVCGCSILVRRSVFETIGYLEEKFFLFWEEADFCVRAKKAGFEVGVCYAARLYHKVSASFIGGSAHKTYFWWRGRFLWIERNCSLNEKKDLFRKILFPEIRHLLKLRWIKGIELAVLKLLRKKDLSHKKSKILQYRSAIQGYLDYKNKMFKNIPIWILTNNKQK